MRILSLVAALSCLAFTLGCSGDDDSSGQGGSATTTMSTLDPDCPPQEPVELTECDQKDLECLYCRPGDTSAPSYRCFELWQPASLTACPEPPPHPSCASYADGQPCPVEGVWCWVYNSSCQPGHAICVDGIWSVTPPTCPY